MPSSLWVASTKRCKDAGSARSRRYGRDRGRGSAPCYRGPEADVHRPMGRYPTFGSDAAKIASRNRPASGDVASANTGTTRSPANDVEK